MTGWPWLGFSWEQPLWLWALLILPVLGWWTVRQLRGGLRAMLLVNARQAHETATALSHPFGLMQRLQPILFLAVLLAGLILIAAGPMVYVSRTEHPVELMLVLDNSLSMMARDVVPSRLAVARDSAMALLRQLPPGVEPGLILFSGDVTVVSGPTDRPEQLAQRLADWDESQLTPNTAIGSALHTALKTFSDTFSRPNGRETSVDLTPARRTTGQGRDGVVRAIVLMSDGDSFHGEPWEQVVPLIRQRHIPVYTIGLGGERPTVIQYKGETLPVTLNEAVLKTIAEETGGRYFAARDGAQLRAVFEQLRQGAFAQVSRPVSLRPQLAMGLILVALGLWLSWVGRWRLWLL